MPLARLISHLSTYSKVPSIKFAADIMIVMLAIVRAPGGHWSRADRNHSINSGIAAENVVGRICGGIFAVPFDDWLKTSITIAGGARIDTFGSFQPFILLTQPFSFRGRLCLQRPKPC